MISEELRIKLGYIYVDEYPADDVDLVKAKQITHLGSWIEFLTDDADDHIVKERGTLIYIRGKDKPLKVLQTLDNILEQIEDLNPNLR